MDSCFSHGKNPQLLHPRAPPRCPGPGGLSTPVQRHHSQPHTVGPGKQTREATDVQDMGHVGSSPQHGGISRTPKPTQTQQESVAPGSGQQCLLLLPPGARGGPQRWREREARKASGEIKSGRPQGGWPTKAESPQAQPSVSLPLWPGQQPLRTPLL